jgi:serine/threonine protein kinase
MPPASTPEQLLHRLPLPLALHHRNAMSAADSSFLQYAAASCLLEDGLQLLASAAITECARRKMRGAVIDAVVDKLALPSLDHWWSYARVLVPALADIGADEFVPVRDAFARPHADLPHAALLDAALERLDEGETALDRLLAPAPPGREVNLARLFDRFVMHRNDLAFGATGRNEPRYPRLGPVLLAGVCEILDRVCLLPGRLVFVKKIVMTAPGEFAVSRLDLTGPSPMRLDPRTSPVSADGVPSVRSRVYLELSAAQPEAAFRSLHPLVAYDQGEEQVEFYNRFDGKRPEYLNFADRRIARSEFTADVENLFRALDRSPEMPAVDPEPTLTLTDSAPGAMVSDSLLTAPGSAPGAMVSDSLLTVPGYEILEQIAQGGLTSVYRARELAFGRDVAIKVPRIQFFSDRVSQRFVEGGRITGQLQHPSIPPVYALSKLPDGRPYLVMRLIKGQTLRELLSARPDLRHDLDRFVSVFERVAEGVGYAHARRVIHRDLKPGNVMVGAFGEVQVMDWELAKVLGVPPADHPAPENRAPAVAPPDDGEITAVGTILGTPAYMAPEQARSDLSAVAERADVFGLGAVLCVILTGQPPYVSDTSSNLVSQASNWNIADAFARLDACGADPKLVALCKRCLARDPVDRPRDAGVLVNELAVVRYSAAARARQNELDWVRPRADAPPPPPPPAPPPRVPLRTGAEAFSSQTVVLRYPAPIALAYRRFCARREPADRAAQLFATFELTIKYLTCLAHADLARAWAEGGPPYPPLPANGFAFLRWPVHMTLGQWLVALAAAADELNRTQYADRFFSELPHVCGSKGIVACEVVGRIKSLRNAWAHVEDGQALTTEECAELLPELRPCLERLFQEVEFLRRYPLGFVTAGDPVGGDHFRYRVHSCMGARVAHGSDVYPLETEARLPVDTPFVVAPDDRSALCLWPLVQFRESDETQRPALYLFKSIKKGKRDLAVIELVAIDHKDNWPCALNESGPGGHDWLWARVAAIPARVPLPAGLDLGHGLTEAHSGRLTGHRLGPRRHLELIAPIARGGFGTVYDAFDHQQNVRVAVKVLEDRDGLDPRAAESQFRRFKKEFENLRRAAAETGGFVSTFEFGLSTINRRDYPWFSMEFAIGGDLAARLDERRTALRGEYPWLSAEARPVVIAEFRTITSAVAALHERNQVHRDIKPGNVLVMEEGVLKLSDFGLVKDLDAPRSGVSRGYGTTDGAVLGTREYAAPEQERGEPVDARADVYSLGVLLAEMSTGRRPTAVAVVTGSPFAGDEFIGRLPERLRKMIVRATDARPDKRYDHAGHLLAEFEAVARRNV